MGQTKTLQVATYCCEDGTDEDSAGGYLQLCGWDRRRLCRWLLTAVRMGQTKILQVATYSNEDGTDEGPAKDPVGPAVRFLSQHVFHVLQEAHYTCTNIDTVTS